MPSEREIEAVKSAVLEAKDEDGDIVWCPQDWLSKESAAEIITRAALEAAARVRAEDNAGGPVAWQHRVARSTRHDPNNWDWSPWKNGRIPEGTQNAQYRKWEERALYTHPAPQPSGTVEVKPLEWKKPKELRFRATCTHFGYEYFIDQTPNGWLLQTYLFGDEYWETLGSYPALDDAMYAAQADYERRILSTLTAGGGDE